MKSRFTTLTTIILTIVILLSPVSGLSRQTQKTQTGKISGAVYNRNGDLLTKATVEVVDKSIVAQTGVDGDYIINLEPGTYSIKFTHDGFREQTIDNVQVQIGQITDLSAILTPLDFKGEEVIITAGNSNDIVSQLTERKQAATISDTISALEISKDTSSSAAGVLQRAPGISLVNDYVFVRGLGERYSNTVLNDSILVTTEPDRKVVPMDLIPSNLLNSVKILKTFTPDQPGEFSGGLVKLDTISMPRATTLSASFSLGFNSQTHGENFLNYPVGDGFQNFFGFGRGSRALPSIIPQNERVLPANPFLPGGFSPDELERFGETFTNIWEPRNEDARPNLGWSVSGGTALGKLGIVGALSFKNDSQSQEEIRRFYRISGPDEITPQHLYDYDVSTNIARLGGALNLAYEVTKDHKFFFKNFLTNQASDETRIFEGFNDDRRTELRNTRLRYIEERIYTGQVSGDHLLTWIGNTIFNWRYTYSRATLDEPDLRETLYEFSPTVGDFIYFNQTQSLFRMFNQMSENLREPAFDVTKLFLLGNKGLNVKAGFSYINRDRVFDSRRFRYVPRGLAGIDITQSPELLLVPGNIASDRGFELREETRTTDHYDALQDITAGYLMGDFTFGRWRFIGGARYEHSKQRVQTFEPFRSEVIPQFAELSDVDWLPSIGIVYGLKNGEMNFRFGYSKTLARPQFRELSPFEFTDVTGGRSTVGNPNLKRTLITNYDLRWEWFVGPSEVVAMSFFYKDMENPIEVVIEPTAQLRTSFRNALGAKNKGVELELRKRLGTFWNPMQNISLNLNYTYVKSDVEIGEQDLSLITNTERPLVGQSENIVNMSLDYDVLRIGAEARVIFNYTGERITDVGALGLPDIIQHGYPTLDAIFAKSFGGEKRFRFEFTAENLLNRQIDFRQDDQPFRVYRTGRGFSIGVSYKIF